MSTEKKFTLKMKSLAELDSSVIKETEKKETSTETLSKYEQCLLHMAKVRAAVMTKQNQRGYNPYLWIAEHLTPLENRIKSERTEDLYSKILALPFDPEQCSVPMAKVKELTTDSGNNPQIPRGRVM